MDYHVWPNGDWHLPPLVADRRQIRAVPHQQLLPAVYAEDHTEAYAFHKRNQVACRRIPTGDLHVMPSIGHHFSVHGCYVAKRSQPDTYTECTIYEIAACDLPATQIEAFWAGLQWTVQVFGVVRIRPATVIGQVAASANNGTLTTPEGTHDFVAGDFILSEFDGSNVRMVPRELMPLEFSCLANPTSSAIVLNFAQPNEPPIRLLSCQ